MGFTRVLSATLLTACAFGNVVAKQPNVVVIMSDDQDARLGSLDAQESVQKLLIAEGLTLDNHFVTTAQCCPSRSSYHRGQAAHNTNMTHVTAPGGGYEKFTAGALDKEYLPHWLKAAGYETEYLGKFMNGYNLATYHPKPKGWDYTDWLVNPYTYDFNNVVTSINGERPKFYKGFHQVDVLRIKTLERLQRLASLDKPFFIQVAPASPHTSPDGPSVPPIRHMWSFNNARAPRNPNFNPDDDIQANKVSWVGALSRLNQSVVDYVDWQQRSRLQALKGVDEMVEDIVEFLKEKGILDETYVIYTSDNGFHMGTHRQIGGKGLPFIEDTTVPMIIRGPGIPRGKVSKVPSTHIDMAPTFLEIAGVAESDFPPFFDGRSLLKEWKGQESNDTGASKEILNVEFWGSIDNAAKPDYSHTQWNNTYKTVRIVGEEQGWLFTRWCEYNATELYNTNDDPYELKNLAINPTDEHVKLMHRLNGLLLVTKSCSDDLCRKPWPILERESGGHFRNLNEAMDSEYDDFFASLPQVGFQQCMFVQEQWNEIPYYPAGSMPGLGLEYREPTGDFESHDTNGTATPGNGKRQGNWAQRYATFSDIMDGARDLTDDEIGTVTTCYAPDYCGSITNSGVRGTAGGA